MTIQVIAVLGYGRSGSTLLNAILGQHPDAIDVGELVQLHHEGWALNNYCSCGRRAQACPFWSEVRRIWCARSGMADVFDYLAMQRRFLRLAAFLTGRSQWNGGDGARFLRATQAIYEAVAEVSGKKIIVDSSKLPVWGFLLSRLTGIRLTAIHLVRDGRGVAHSLSKAYEKNTSAGVQTDIPGRPVWRSALSWSFYNLLAEFVLARRRIPSIRLRYEDLTADPNAVLRRIGALLGADFNGVADLLKSGASIKPHHMIAGNRLRMQSSIKLQPDLEWRRRMSQGQELCFWGVAGPVALRYGYVPRRPRARGPVPE